MKTERKGFRQMVDEAKSRIKTISLQDARSRLGKDDVVFVDVRDVRELEREGKVPGAFHCPRGMLEFWLDPDSPYHKDVFAADKEFIFYCNGAWRSAHAADVARQMGLERARDGRRVSGMEEEGFPGRREGGQEGLSGDRGRRGLAGGPRPGAPRLPAELRTDDPPDGTGPDEPPHPGPRRWPCVVVAASLVGVPSI